MADFVEALRGGDLSLPCTGGRSFCGMCREASCQTCCPEHAAVHHPAVGDAIRRVIGVSLLDGQFPAVSATSVKTTGMGYNWNYIERIPHGDSYWVMLTADHPRWNRGKLGGNCKPCDVRVRASSDHCSAACKVAMVRRRRSWQVVERLVNVSPSFRIPHFADRFCTACHLFFQSEFCPDHLQHHHAPGAEVNILTIIRHDGWFLIPQHQVQPHLTEGIKRVQLTDGTHAVPIRARMFPIVGPTSCDAAGCDEAVDVVGEFCSLNCHADFQN